MIKPTRTPRLIKMFKRMLQPPLKLYWWRYDYPSKLNFGDEITPLIISRLFKINSIWTDPKDAKVIGAGSILEVVQDLSDGNSKILVWGSGSIENDSIISTDKFIFCCVRGKLTAKKIGVEDIALGDPGLLANLAFPELQNIEKKYKIGIIPHYADAMQPALDPFRQRGDILIINATDPVESVLAQINSCEIIFSSSLHGLIVSDSYGIPNYWTPLSENITGGDFKFNDYYSVFNMTASPIDLEYGVKNAANLITKYVKPDVKTVQKNIIEAFPY